MVADKQLVDTIDRILAESESGLLSRLDEAHAASSARIDESGPMLEEEYDRIIDEGRKEADKVSRQIVGGADLKARNAQLVLVEESISAAFDRAVERIRSADRAGADYARLVETLLRESTDALGTTDVVVSTSAGDEPAVRAALGKIEGAEMSGEAIDCLGGVRVRSRDGTMSYDNTLDSRIERMKPLIRKEIAAQFGTAGSE